MVTCEICGKQVKTTQALRGHKYFVHSDTGSGIGQPVAQQAAQQPLSSNLGTRVTTEQRLSQLENRFARLEQVTGLCESELLDRLSDEWPPLTEQLSGLTQLLNEQADQLQQLTEHLELVEVHKTISDEQQAEFGRVAHRVSELMGSNNELVSIVNKNAEMVKTGLLAIQGDVDLLFQAFDAHKHNRNGACVLGCSKACKLINDRVAKANEGSGKLPELADDVRNGQVEEPGWRYLQRLDMSIRDDGGD